MKNLVRRPSMSRRSVAVYLACRRCRDSPACRNADWNNIGQPRQVMNMGRYVATWFGNRWMYARWGPLKRWIWKLTLSICYVNLENFTGTHFNTLWFWDFTGRNFVQIHKVADEIIDSWFTWFLERITRLIRQCTEWPNLPRPVSDSPQWRMASRKLFFWRRLRKWASRNENMWTLVESSRKL